MAVVCRKPALIAALFILAAGCASRAKGPKIPPRDEFFWHQPPAAIKLDFTMQMLAAIDEERKAWQADERSAHGEIQGALAGATLQQAAMLHCHIDGSFDGARGRSVVKASKPYAVPTLVGSTSQPVGVCPNWPVVIDSAYGHRDPTPLGAQSKPRRPFPATLISGLDSAMRAKPQDTWYLRQLVRALTENGEHARAAAILDQCTHDMWCYALRGYVQYVQGNWLRASTDWEEALPLMSAERRCQVLMTDELLPRRNDAWGGASCLQRGSLDENVWWLSKPLLSDSLNYRWVEHLARQVRTALTTDLLRDAHYDLRPETGSDAVHRMRLRYGWPAHAHWGGRYQDDGHLGYLRTKTRAAPLPPYSSPEYSRDVVSTTPRASAAAFPFRVQDADFAIEPETDYSDERPWPQEFFRHPNGVLLHIRTQQRALLRRDTTVLLVAAVNLPVPRATTGPDSVVRLQLLASSSPATVKQVDVTSARWGNRAFVSGELRQPAVIGFEVNRGGARVAGARMRFGVPVIETHATSRSRCALSEPILLDASVLAGAETAKLQHGMLSDLALRRPEKLGLLWESYGVRAGDSVTLSVRVTGAQDRSGLARAAQSLGIVGQQDVAIAVSWKEPSPARRAEVIPGMVATLRRDLMLDISTLRSGSYGVQVTMTAAGCEATSPVRQFSVTR